MIALDIQLKELFEQTQEDFWVAQRFKVKDKIVCLPWQKVSEYLQGKPVTDKNKKEHYLKPNYRTILKHENVLESDEDKLTNAKMAQKAISIFKKNNLSFECWFTGSKSYHLHLYFKNLKKLSKTQRTKAKELFAEEIEKTSLQGNKPLRLIFDYSNFKPKRLIQIEGSINPKTGLNSVLVTKSKSNNLNELPQEIIDKALQVKEKKELKTTKNLYATPGTCKALDYALENELPHGGGKNKHSRFEWVSPNMAAYIRKQENREELAQQYYLTQNKNTGELECWDNKPSSFCCEQLRTYMKAIDKGTICDKCLLEAGLNG